MLRTSHSIQQTSLDEKIYVIYDILNCRCDIKKAMILAVMDTIIFAIVYAIVDC